MISVRAGIVTLNKLRGTVDTWNTAKWNITGRSQAQTVLSGFPAAKIILGKATMYCLTQMSGNMAGVQKGRAFLWVTCKPVLVPCNDPGQWVSLWWEINTFTPALHQQVWGYNTTVLEAVPGIRITLFVSNHTVMLTAGERSHSSKPALFTGCTQKQDTTRIFS